MRRPPSNTDVVDLADRGSIVGVVGNSVCLDIPDGTADTAQEALCGPVYDKALKVMIAGFSPRGDTLPMVELSDMRLL